MNQQTLTQRFLSMTVVGAAAATLALSACSPRDAATTPTAATPTGNDAVVVTNDAQRADIKADVANGADRAKDATREAAQDVKQAGENAGAKISDTVSDAVITTSVNAELAKDSELSALKINVDTDAGRVALKGTAPSEAAREHATALAGGVKGVVSVDNQLTVAPK